MHPSSRPCPTPSVEHWPGRHLDSRARRPGGRLGTTVLAILFVPSRKCRVLGWTQAPVGHVPRALERWSTDARFLLCFARTSVIGTRTRGAYEASIVLSRHWTFLVGPGHFIRFHGTRPSCSTPGALGLVMAGFPSTLDDSHDRPPRWIDVAYRGGRPPLPASRAR